MTLWAVIRDDELYEAYPSKHRAEESAEFYRPGSKHKWRVCKVEIEAWHESRT